MSNKIGGLGGQKASSRITAQGGKIDNVDRYTNVKKMPIAQVVDLLIAYGGKVTPQMDKKSLRKALEKIMGKTSKSNIDRYLMFEDLSSRRLLDEIFSRYVWDSMLRYTMLLGVTQRYSMLR